MVTELKMSGGAGFAGAGSVSPSLRLLWFLAHLAGIALGIWAGVQFVHWALSPSPRRR